jgi:HEAT repeat protein
MANEIRQLSLEIIRDLYGSSKRLAMYPLGHPSTQDVLKKPLGGLNEIFSFKHSFVIELFKDRLLAEGILLDNSVFVSGLSIEMKKHKLANVVFSSSLTIGDLYHFLSTLMSRPGPYEDNLARILSAKNVEAISVNAENPPRLFHFDNSASSGISQFPLDERIEEIVIHKPDIIVAYYLGKLYNDDDLYRELGIDLRLSFMARYFKTVMRHLDPEQGITLIESAVLSTNWLDDSVDSKSVQGLKKLFEDYLPEKSDEATLSAVYKLLKKVGAPEQVMNQIFSKSSYLKLMTFQETENIVETLKYSDPAQVDPAVLKKTVFKLATSKQTAFLHDLLDQLIRSLSSTDAEQRSKSVSLITTVAEILASSGFFEEYNYICKEVVRHSLSPSQSSESVELVSDLIMQALKSCRWGEFKVLTRTLRGVCDDQMQSENKRQVAALKLSEISNSDLLFRTASNLSEQGKSDEANEFFEGLSPIGSDEIIKMLASKITFPDINVRSRMIKVLINMKGNVVGVLIEMLKGLITRSDGASISDEEWYFYRNVFRVLRETQAVEAIPYLETLSSWPLPRLKLEIIKTLEGMPAERAFPMLDKFSREEEPEIRKAAAVTMGFIGDPIMIPALYNVFKRDPGCRIAAVASLGRIGDSRARDKLIELLDDNALFKELNITRREAEEIRAVILKALSIIGDEIAVAKVTEYASKVPDKSIFGIDLLSSTAKILLGGKMK